jgi:hypothetical protein
MSSRRKPRPRAILKTSSPNCPPAKKPKIHELRERAPRDFVGRATLRDDVAAPNFAMLGSDPEHLVLQPP